MRIKDLLRTDGLKDAFFVAGQKNMDGIISSVSVLEVTEDLVKAWIHENELYISSFYAIRNDVDKQMELIDTLNESKVSALILCHVGKVMCKVDKRLIQKCNTMHFPVIVAEPNRTFIEIMGPIINQLENEKYGKNMQADFFKYITLEKDLRYLLRVLSNSYGKDFLLLNEKREILYSRLRRNIEDYVEALRSLDDESEWLNKNVYFESVINDQKSLIYKIVKHKVLKGYIISKYDGELQETLKKMKITSEYFAQIIDAFDIESILFLREQEYLNDLLTWNFKSIEIAVKIGESINWCIASKSRILIIDLSDPEKRNLIFTSTAGKNTKHKVFFNIKKAVKEENKNNCISANKDMYVIFLENDSNDIVKRVEKLCTNIIKICEESSFASVVFGISGKIIKLNKMKKTFSEAIIAIKVGKTFFEQRKIFFYDEIGILGMFDEIQNYKEFKNIKAYTFKKLIENDKNSNEELYNTLITLALCNFNTEKAAKQLFVHRNTVNFRKRKICDILGFIPWEMPHLINTLMIAIKDSI